MEKSRQRIHSLRGGDMGKGPVVYWMSREQRVHQNWPLLIAQQRAIELHKPLQVVFCLDLSYPSATLRHFGFMLRGIAGLPPELNHCVCRTHSGTIARRTLLKAANCTAICGCTGPKRSWSGAKLRNRLWQTPSSSTTATPSTAEIPTVTPASLGP